MKKYSTHWFSRKKTAQVLQLESLLPKNKQKAHAAINNRTFWPAPAYVRLWKFQDKTSAVTEVTDSILVSGGTERNSSTAAQLPSDKDGPVC